MIFRIASAGLGVVAAATAVLVGCAAGTLAAFGGAWPAWPITAVLLAAWLWVLYFFRDPDRAVPTTPGLLVSPADGVVSDITPVGAESELGCEGMRVGVFMNVFNVHVNRVPCDGRVERLEHSRGSYRDVRRPEAWGLNESMTVRLACPFAGRELPVVVRQVAGLVARRIVCDLREGERVSRGQRLGMIRFGSRLEVLWPAELNARTRVAVGQKVFGGSSVLAEVADAQGDGPDER